MKTKPDLHSGRPRPLRLLPSQAPQLTRGFFVGFLFIFLLLGFLLLLFLVRLLLSFVLRLVGGARGACARVLLAARLAGTGEGLSEETVGERVLNLGVNRG